MSATIGLRAGKASRDLVGVVGVAEDRTDLVAALGENACEWQRDLAVAADDDDACHASRRYPRLRWLEVG